MRQRVIMPTLGAPFRRSVFVLYAGISVATGVAVLAKAALVQRLIGQETAGLAQLMLSPFVLAPLLVPVALRFRRILAPLAVLGMVAVVLVVQTRMSELAKIGRGSDQSACIAAASRPLLELRWPFDLAAIWSHNPYSCGPAWIAGHAPLVLAFGYPVAMLLVMLAAIAAVFVYAGRDPATRFLTYLALIPGVWLAFANGNDFVSYGLVLAGAVAFAASGRGGRGAYALVPVLVALSGFRLPLMFLPALFVRAGTAPVRRAAWAALAIGTAIWLAYFAWNPAAFMAAGPGHSLNKMLVRFGGQMDASDGAVVGFLGIVAALALFAWLVNRVFAFPGSCVVLLFCVLMPFTVLDLSAKLQMADSLAIGLQFWEGPSWLTALGVVCAALLACSDAPEPGRDRARAAPFPRMRSEPA